MEDGSTKTIRAREQKVLCEIVSGKNDWEASPTNPQQYRCINKIWIMTAPINMQAWRGRLGDLTGPTHRHTTPDNYDRGAKSERTGEIVLIEKGLDRLFLYTFCIYPPVYC